MTIAKVAIKRQRPKLELSYAFPYHQQSFATAILGFYKKATDSRHEEEIRAAVFDHLKSFRPLPEITVDNLMTTKVEDAPTISLDTSSIQKKLIEKGVLSADETLEDTRGKDEEIIHHLVSDLEDDLFLLEEKIEEEEFGAGETEEEIEEIEEEEKKIEGTPKNEIWDEVEEETDDDETSIDDEIFNVVVPAPQTVEPVAQVATPIPQTVAPAPQVADKDAPRPGQTVVEYIREHPWTPLQTAKKHFPSAEIQQALKFGKLILHDGRLQLG